MKGCAHKIVFILGRMSDKHPSVSAPHFLIPMLSQRKSKSRFLFYKLVVVNDSKMCLQISGD